MPTADPSRALSGAPLLPQGGTIGLVSPSRWSPPERIAGLQRALEAAGYRTVSHPQNAMRAGRLAGEDGQRAAAINELFADPAIDAVFCTRGGTGAMLLLDLLDYDLIRRNPKPFVGLSDITALLQAITARTGLVTYHGPMDWNFLPQNEDPRTMGDLLTALAAGEGERALTFSDVTVARAGTATGRLVGGNLCLLQHLIGTPYDWNARGGVLFIEDIGEPLYKIERMLAHLRLAGKLDGVQALLVGPFLNLEDASEKADIPYGRDVREIVLRHAPPDVPVAFDVPCGHAAYTTTFPVGAQVRVTLEGGQAEVRWTP